MSTTTNRETHQNGEDRVPEVEAMIDAKLQELAQIPVGPHGGRRLEIGGVSPEESDSRRHRERLSKRLEPVRVRPSQRFQMPCGAGAKLISKSERLMG
jgi:hypothetical protein